MKKSALPFALLFLTVCSSPLFAQQSIGFSDSTDFQYILDYRLPDWGYSNFYLTSGRFQTRNNYISADRKRFNTNPEATATINSDHTSHSISLTLTPAYQYYRESEQQILSLNTNLDVGSGIRNQSNKVEGSTTEDNYIIQEQDYHIKEREASVRYSIDLNSKYYAWETIYISGSINGNIGFSKTRDKIEDNLNPNSKENRFTRRILFNPQLGIGFGRIRNVAPQIRAIRLKERYQKISNQSLTNDEIINTAEQFTRIQQYKRTRDRHQKYFWDDMNELLSGKLDVISAYDLFYLNDVLNENLGQRYEGFDISISGRYGYQNSLSKIKSRINDEQQNSRYFNINRSAAAISRVRWYKNLSLNHQLGFEGESELAFSFEKDHNIKYRTDIFADFSWLWTITDRYLLTTSLRNYYSKPVFKERIQNRGQFDNETSLSSSFSYFIENRLSLTGSLSANLDFSDYEHPERIDVVREINWNAAISIRYYFDRNLF